VKEIGFFQGLSSGNYRWSAVGKQSSYLSSEDGRTTAITINKKILTLKY
jgi:hypothetical protein